MYRVRYSSVNDSGLFNATSYGFNTAVYLWYHSAAYDAFLFEIRHIADVYLWDKCGIIVLVLQQTNYIRHKDKLFRSQTRSNSRRRSVSIDIVRLSVLTNANCGDYRNITVVKCVNYRLCRHLFDVAHKTKVNFAVKLLRKYHLPVTAAKTESLSAMELQSANKLLVYLAAKHHFNDIYSFSVSVSQTVYELAFNADSFEHCIYLRATAMNKNYLYAYLA